VLLLLNSEDDPTTAAWLATLESWGVPHDALQPRPDEPLKAEALTHDDGHGRYNAVVLSTDSSVFWTSLAVLREYRRQFGVRQVNAFEYPRPTHGLCEVAGRPMGGSVAALTEAGQRQFGYLAGRVPIDGGGYGYASSVLDPARFTAMLVTQEGESLLGSSRSDDGLEDLLLTVNYSWPMLHWRLLAPGLLAWATRGRHLGMSRNYLACHVDDVLLSNWRTPGHGSAEKAEPASTVRMVPDDVREVAAWQRRHGFTLDLAINGHGGQDVTEPLTKTLIDHRTQFRWLNHTWSHLDMGKATESRNGSCDWRDVLTLREEIERNRQWAQAVDVPLSDTALVTGCHSGLDNPNLPAALELSGVTAVAADASRTPAPAYVGDAVTVPRHPTNIYTHVSTWPELLSEYRRYHPEASDAPDHATAFLEAENQVTLRHMLGNDPRPLFAHQSNLTNDRLLLRLLEHALALYNSYFSPEAPVQNLSMDDIALELRRREHWLSVRRSDRVSATVDKGVVTITSRTDTEVPVSMPRATAVARRWRRRAAFGAEYGGRASQWLPIRAGDTLRLLPSKSR
jgi:hypothetical protein